MLNLCSQTVRFIPVHLGWEDKHGKEHFSHKPCEKKTRYLWGTGNIFLLFTLFQNCEEEEINQSREEAELSLDPASRDQNEFRKASSIPLLPQKQWSPLQLPAAWGGWGDRGGQPCSKIIES